MSRRGLRVVLLVAVFCAVFGVASFLNSRHTAAAINPQINFQGKLTNPDGTNVTNGTYSIRFRIYTDPSLDSANACAANTCKWEETQASVSVTDGIFDVSLGSGTALPGSVDFNSSALYLGIKVSTDLEMTPRIQLTSSPYAFNADKVGGLATTSLTQLGQGVQADSSSTNPSIFINKTGATAKILELQNNGADVFNVNNDGSVLSQNSANSTTAFQVQSATGAIAFAVDTTPLNTLLANGGMEGTSNTSWALKAGTGSVSRDTSQQYSGLASEKVALTSIAIGDGAKFTVNTTLAATTQYTATFTLKQTAGTAFTTNLQVGLNSSADIPCTSLTPTLTDQPVPTTGWARYTCVFTSDASPAASDFLYWKELDAPGAARTFFIDAVQLEQGATGSAYQETGLTFNGVVASPVAFKNVTDSASSLIVQNSSGLGIFLIDTLNSRVYIGGLSLDSTGVLLVLDSKNTTGDPTGVNGASYYNSDDRRSRCYENDQYVDCRGTARPNSRRWSLIEYPGTGAAAGSMSAMGDTGTATANAFASVAASAAEPTMLQTTTSAVNGNQAGLISGNVNYLLGGRNVLYQTYLAVTPTTTNVRVWAGLTNQTAGVMGAAANPAGRYAAFRFDTGAGDANWQCITKDNVTQNIINSTVAISTAGVKLEILEKGTTDIIFRINGVRVCTSSANLPGANILARRLESITNLSAATHSIDIAWVYVESDR